MKTLITTTAAILTLLLLTSFASAQTTLVPDQVESMRQERSVYLFNQQNKHDLQKQKEMGEAFSLNVEKANLDQKRAEVQIVDLEDYPKMVETNNPQQGAWEYAQAKKAWVDAHPTQYAALMQGASAE